MTESRVGEIRANQASYNERVIRLVLRILLVAAPVASQQVTRFEVHEATIAEVHAAMRAGRLTCRALVGQYLQRISTYDKNGPAINSIVVINSNAEREAEELDHRFE